MPPAASLQLWALPDIPAVAAGDDLAAIALQALARAGLQLASGDVLVLAQKVVSKSEGRAVDLRTVEPGAEAQRLAAIAGKDPRLVELILRESAEVLRCKPGVIVVRHRRGWVLANAGIDQSNVGAQTHALLLPVDPDASAAALRARIAAASGTEIGVVISDSLGRAWRLGTVGTALGAAGLPSLLDLRGRADRDGRRLQTTEVGHADEIAAAASLLMGQADEGRPIVLLRGLPGAGAARPAADLIRPPAEDLFK